MNLIQKITIGVFTTCCIAVNIGCKTLPSNLAPPDIEARPVTSTVLGHTRVDPYAWLREKENPEVIAYLEEENAYTMMMTEHTKDVQVKLYDEMLSRIKEDDSEVPWRKDGYLYYSRTEEHKPYDILCRRFGSMDASEEVILDINERAKGGGYCSVTSVSVSPNGRLLAWLEDTTGYEHANLYIKDLSSNEIIESGLHDLSPWALAWGNDNETLLYTRQDAANRADRVFRHRIGADPADDELVFHEPDERFSVDVSRSRSGDVLFIEVTSQVTSKILGVPADDPWGTFRTIIPHQQGVELSIEHAGDYFYIRTNDEAPNFKVVKVPISNPAKNKMQEVVPYDKNVYVLGIHAFQNHLVISQRRNGYLELRIVELQSGKQRIIDMPETVATVRPGTNAEFGTDVFRFVYTSLITPRSVYDENLITGERTLLKRTEVLGEYHPNEYVASRITAVSSDGTNVPISLVHRKDVKPDGTNPLLLYGYGSYGASMDPYFSSARISLLDRGVVFAIAHIRGGSEMGRNWYEDGKFLHKKHTFEDFIACAEALRDVGWAAPNRIAIQGASAGGMLIGAVVNMRPDLFCVAHAGVPFVDVMNTMLDPTIPLTVVEYEEWGNPADPIYYDYMQSYSPYDNVTAQEYPALLVTAGLNDPRVHYWEPAKWVARLRDLSTGNNELLLKTNMGAGHGGSSGRYERLREIAFEYAFLLDHLGVVESKK